MYNLFVFPVRSCLLFIRAVIGRDERVPVHYICLSNNMNMYRYTMHDMYRYAMHIYEHVPVHHA